MPATTLCTARDIAQRIERAQATIAVVDDEAAAQARRGARPLPVAAPRHRRRRRPPRPGSERYDELIARASDAAADASAMTRADDPLLLYFTSGTVAAPKMVLHTHASMGAGHEITARFWQDLTPADLHWTFSDTGWAKAAWGKLFGQWRMGASVFLWDQRGKLDPELCLRVLERSGVTTFCAPPTLFRAFVQLDLAAFDLGARPAHRLGRASRSTRRSSAPGARRPGRRSTTATGRPRRSTSSPTSRASRCAPARWASRRRATTSTSSRTTASASGRTRRATSRSRPSPSGPVGLMPGYWRDDDANAEVFHDGWYFTGDRARKDEDGYFWFVSRADDVIISASYRIGPFEVESALVEHPAVAESAVVGKPDPERTSIVKAFVVLAPGYEALGRARQRAAGARQGGDRALQVPARGRVRRPALPKTISGKIRRSELRERT